MYRKQRKEPRKNSLLASIRHYVCVWAILFFFVSLCSCSSRKFLLPGQTVLSEVKVKSESKSLKAGQFRNFVRQEPNARWFGLAKVPLGIYCMSKSDSVRGAKGMSRLLRKIGEAPVIYDSQQTAAGMFGISEGMRSEGYLHALTDTLVTHRKHKTRVTYVLRPGRRYYVNRLDYDFDDAGIYRIFRQDSSATLLKRGLPLNLNQLSEERSRIINELHNRGYYYLNKDYITYDIDTVAYSTAVNVTLRFRMPAGIDTLRAYRPQFFRNVVVKENPDIAEGVKPDTVGYRSLRYVAPPSGKSVLTKRTYIYHVGLRPDSIYREKQVHATYSNLNSLPVVSYTTLNIKPVPGSCDLLDCDILVCDKKPNSVEFELEGTNTAGDLGAAAALTFSNRNMFKGSEQLSVKLRGAYEAISGLEGYTNRNFSELSAEASLRFPTLLLPFVSIGQKRYLKASSEVRMMYDMQDRPEFHRRVLTGAWTYQWNNTSRPDWQHRYDLLSLNYIYMPWISDTFRKDYLEGEDPHYSVLRYSYENLFVMRTGYGFVYNSLRDKANRPTGLYQTDGFQVKMNVEIAGNLFYAFSKVTRRTKSQNGAYKLFGIEYSQYAKVDFDFAKSVVLQENNSLAFHVAMGFGLPYGNSTILPYEKRYFAGGANSVRGWSVRDLGPGAYRSKDGKVDFVNQTGNLKLEMSIEWRTHLFWKLHGAFFVDAGNVWNTRSYPDMDGALFRFSSFYRQIAVSYGVGVRMNFDYFILRLDGGMKAIDPAVPSGRLHYPLISPNMGRDFAFHFAVGLPF